ncbi:Imm63 family immunity protein [Paenibacillus sp. WLX1005]|uniref:Imm63 family immunity protein n=1 Tax=Paenibacillus sp. WLX1005 TaxID=3243766 RepID=UPI003984415F
MMTFQQHNIQTAEQLIQTIDELLQRTDTYRERQRQMAAAAFDPSWYGDLQPHIQVQHDGYLLELYERGVNMMSKKTTEADDVIYWILEDVIFSHSYVLLMETYNVDNITTHLRLTPEITAELDGMVNAAFDSIGGVYQQWHQQGRRSELERGR